MGDVRTKGEVRKKEKGNDKTIRERDKNKRKGDKGKREDKK